MMQQRPVAGNARSGVCPRSEMRNIQEQQKKRPSPGRWMYSTQKNIQYHRTRLEETSLERRVVLES